MISSRDVVTGIFVAWRLFLFDRSALRVADSTIEGFWKSFYAAVIALPAVFVLRVLFVDANPELVAPSSTARIALVFALDYVYQWIVFPLVMLPIADALVRSDRYVTFIVARNWAQVIQVAIVLPAAVLLVTQGSEGPGFAQLLFWVAHLVVWVYSWFIARAALGISGVAAALIVFVELVISVLISVVSELLIAGG